MSLLFGDCVKQMKSLPENSIDSVVCDPPYELGFMGKSWDASGIAYNVDMWKEVLRVMKPGAHLLAFGGTRTYHRMACAIEDAGFEIRDQLQWLYGSGFPKSFNIGKGVDKLQGNQREEIGLHPNPAGSSGEVMKTGLKQECLLTKGNSVWEGWGSALKPMNEPICLARKPLSEKTIVENCLKWGVGGLNIDDSRIFCGTEHMRGNVGAKVTESDWKNNSGFAKPFVATDSPLGRFPGNVLLDEEAAELLDEQSGIVSQGHWSKTKTTGFGEFGNGKSEYFGVGLKDKTKSGASRFFYVAKASKSERNKGCDELPFGDAPGSKRSTPAEGRNNALGNPRQNHHPTVKPVRLMEYLVRLVTPRGGVVLDPFMGSGTTGIACRNLGFKFIGIEKEKEYFDIAKERIKAWEGQERLL